MHLVSGAAGFIGSHLCERLVDSGEEVVGVDNLICGSIENLKSLKQNGTFHFIESDVTQPLTLLNRPIDHVWHLASLASPVHYFEHPIETLEVGSLGTRRLLETAREWGAKFLLASTSECYGNPLVHPQTEDYFGNVSPVGVRSCYDESKRYAEAITMAYCRTFGINTHIARIFNTYGPRMALNDGRVVPTFILQALSRQPMTVHGDGLQTRSFCYVADMVDGLIRLMNSEEHEPVNLGNPEELTMLKFAELIRQAVGEDSGVVFEPPREEDPRQRCPDIKKAQSRLSWGPTTKLQEGLAKTIAYFRSFS